MNLNFCRGKEEHHGVWKTHRSSCDRAGVVAAASHAVGAPPDGTAGPIAASGKPIRIATVKVRVILNEAVNKLDLMKLQAEALEVRPGYEAEVAEDYGEGKAAGKNAAGTGAG